MDGTPVGISGKFVFGLGAGEIEGVLVTLKCLVTIASKGVARFFVAIGVFSRNFFSQALLLSP